MAQASPRARRVRAAKPIGPGPSREGPGRGEPKLGLRLATASGKLPVRGTGSTRRVPRPGGAGVYLGLVLLLRLSYSVVAHYRSRFPLSHHHDDHRDDSDLPLLQSSIGWSCGLIERHESHPGPELPTGSGIPSSIRRT
jgi:hypothetical protein